MHPRRPPADSRRRASRSRYVHSFAHLFDVRAFLERRLCISIDAIRALHGVRDGQRDQGLLTLGKRAFREHRSVPIRKLLPKLRRVFADLRETRQVLLVVITGHFKTSWLKVTV